MVNDNLLIGFGFLLGIFILYKFFTRKKIDKKYQEEITEILNSDKYKVKSRFED
ncbi:MAG: hypothetical protein ABII01_07395 [Candidatus Woesearchaeota archaeon]